MSLTEEWLKTKVNNWFNMRYLLKSTIEDSIENILNKSMVELNVMLLDRIWSSNDYKNIIFLHPIVKEAIDVWLSSLSNKQLLELNIIDIINTISYWLFCDDWDKFNNFIGGAYVGN